jgi:bifunctional enzyme CysN/CysC
MTALALARALVEHQPPALRLVPETRAAIPGPAQGTAPNLARDLASSLHVLTCGSVDDGKSTLIGRLLWDTAGLPADQRATVERSPRTAAGTPDFSLLVDGLTAEREQGITIDIAWRYLDTPTRRLVIIDSPGHEQYTRNMASGASHADVAILLVDARGGLKEQTRRHAALLDLIGVRRVVLAVNKMDLVDWSEARFGEIRAEFIELARRFGFKDAAAIPVSAVLGDNIAQPSLAMPWYTGPLLLDHLVRIPARGTQAGGAFRFPVQFVVRAGQDFRGLAGTIGSGVIRIGDEVVEPVGGRRARVARIVTMDRDLPSARQGQAVVLQLDTDIDVSRGAVLAAPGSEPSVTRSLGTRLVWLSDERFSPDRRYLLRTATDIMPVSTVDIRAHLDLETLSERAATTCSANDIALVRINLGRSTAIDAFADQHETGSFMLIDAITGASVAGGIVTAAQSGESEPQPTTLRLMLELEGWSGNAGIDPTIFWLNVLAVLSFGFIGSILFGLI